MGKYEYKKESAIIFACIMIILTFYCFYFFSKLILNKIELFSNGNSKRDKMKKIYKSDEILDPDEITMDSPSGYDDCDDPDGTCSSDQYQ